MACRKQTQKKIFTERRYKTQVGIMPKFWLQKNITRRKNWAQGSTFVVYGIQEK